MIVGTDHSGQELNVERDKVMGMILIKNNVINHQVKTKKGDREKERVKKGNETWRRERKSSSCLHHFVS